MRIRPDPTPRPLIPRLTGAWMIAACLSAGSLCAQSNLASKADAASPDLLDSVAGKRGGSAGAVAESAWGRLRDKAADAASRGSGKTASVDWTGLAAEAEKFRRDFPDNAQARAAAKIRANALIRADDSVPELSPNTKAVADEFVADHKNPTRDRVEIKIALEQAKLSRVKFAGRREYLLAHSAHARDLISRFPDQPEGYGYLLSLAKGESTENFHTLADELLAGNAPEPFKRGARRVLDRLQLVGRPLQLAGAEAAIQAAKGKALVVYSWRTIDDGFLEIVNRLGAIGDTAFIGINIDANVRLAKGKAAALKLPGTQFYDGGGLDGPLARQLQLITGASLYLVDGGGVVRDVNGQHDAAYKLQRLVWNEEGTP